MIEGKSRDREGGRERQREMGGGGGREQAQLKEIIRCYTLPYIYRREFFFLCGFTIDWILLIAQVISDNFHVMQS